MNFDHAMYEVLKVDIIKPQTLAPGSISSDWLPMADDGRLLAIISVGAMTGTATLDAKLEKAQDALGTGVTTMKDFNGSDIKITQLDDTHEGDIVMLEITDEMLRKGFTHVRLTLTGAAANVVVGAVILRGVTDYPPVDRTGYQEVVLGHPDLPHTLDI